MAAILEFISLLLRVIFLVLLVIFLLIVFVAGFDLYVRNSHLVTVNYYGGKWEVEVALLIALALFCGALLGIFARRVDKFVRARRTRTGRATVPGTSGKQGVDIHTTPVKDAS